MAIIESFMYAPFDESDPDDFRPKSKWALLVDPGRDAESHVDNIALIFEVIGVGDRIPLHVHPIHEVIVVDEGAAHVTLGDETRDVGRGTVVFIPAGTPHATRNSGDRPVRLHAMFPSEQIGIEYLERNPAPGTEDRAPQPAFTIDARALADG
jgi:mannose-6-phosphate isomerase-like protein (cupin superfamily)